MSARSKLSKHTITRRGVLAGMLAWSSGALAVGVEQAVPNSIGSAPPRLDVPADSCVRVGSLQIEAPDAPDGSVVVLQLDVTGAGDPVTDRDETIVKR